MILPEMLSFLSTLDPELVNICVIADSFIVSDYDIHDENFQIAADILAVFEKYAERRRTAT